MGTFFFGFLHCDLACRAPRMSHTRSRARRRKGCKTSTLCRRVGSGGSSSSSFMNNDMSCEDIMDSIDATSASAAQAVSLLLNFVFVALLYLYSAITLLHSPARVRRLLARQGCSFFIPNPRAAARRRHSIRYLMPGTSSPSFFLWSRCTRIAARARAPAGLRF